MRNKLATLFSITCLLLLPLASASAHGDITQAIPAADSTVIAAPTEVSIEFDGKLQTLGNEAINLITVTDNMGQVISSPSSVVDGTKISTRLLLTDITGLVAVHYRVVSEDGHPVEGDYSFTVGQLPVATSADIEEINETENGTEESKSLSFAAIFAILFAAVSGFVIIRRMKRK
jgi:methionine-rich copper-binding protein CopC